MSQRPSPKEYAEYYKQYISLVPKGNIIDILEDQQKSLMGFFSSIDEEKANYRYAENKWSVKEVLGHIIDGERIFAYRALRLSRGDSKPLMSFEQNSFITNSNYGNTQFEKIVDEFFLLRASNILMFRNFSNEMWLRRGTVDDKNISVRAIAYLMAGHTEHHINVLQELYGC
jgi:hypothetical protein